MNLIKKLSTIRISSKRFFYFSLQLLLFIAIYFGVKYYTQRNLVDNIPPTLTASFLSGQKFNLQEHLDKPILLHFWASWCPVCNLEESSIQSISENHNVVTIAMQSGNEKELTSYMLSKNINFPVIADNDGAIAQRFGVQAVPVSFIIHSNGKIMFIESGFTSSWGLRARLWLANLL